MSIGASEAIPSLSALVSAGQKPSSSPDDGLAVNLVLAASMPFLIQAVIKGTCLARPVHGSSSAALQSGPHAHALDGF